MTTLPKINISPVFRPKVLLAPLDWGLGHATRCIPIVKELLNQQCEVWIAASGDQKALLQEEFPFLRFVELPGYNVKYGKNRAFTLLKIFGSIPKILIQIKRENGWLRRFLVTEKPDAIISDNRYGLYAIGLPSVFITHQLRIRTPLGAWADTLLQRLHYRAIRPFSFCWVPDREGADSLAGNLSHPGKLPSIPTRYIGWLSRFERPGVTGMGGRSDETPGLSEKMPGSFDGTGERSGEVLPGLPENDETPPGLPGNDEVLPGLPENEASTCDLLILLSGPEPQRTIFEKLVLGELAVYSGKVILVRGLPGADFKNAPGAEGKRAGVAGGGGKGAARGGVGVRVYNHLPAGRLNGVINGAGIVLCRAGYSTIMDLVKLGKKAILIPTPGQTEQEYLGSYLSGKGIALCREQRGFSLAEALEGAQTFPFAGFSEERTVQLSASSGDRTLSFVSPDKEGERTAHSSGEIKPEEADGEALPARYEAQPEEEEAQPEGEEDLLQQAVRVFLASLVIDRQNNSRSR